MIQNSFNLNYKQKQTLNISLKLWLPILQSSLNELDRHFQDMSNKNPFLEVKRAYEIYPSSSSADYMENMVDGDKESLYEKLLSQIEAPLFPTKNSQKVAMEIVENINEDGYFDGDTKKIANECNTTNEFVESIRKRFHRLEPSGVGAIDVKESFLFQLDAMDSDIDDGLYDILVKIIKNINKIDKYATHHRFQEVKEIISKFSNPPAIEYKHETIQIIPDFFVKVGDDINIKINNSYYPDIKVANAFSSKNDGIKEKLREAKDMVNLLELRKATLYKIILTIVEKQISFFIGGELKPLTMSQVADELSFAESTISRAVANKYIECKQGVFPLKHFFTNEVSDKDISSAEIKSYIKNLVEFEERDTPLTDDDIANKVFERFQIKIVRRTVTKYRKLLDIPSSKERKKIYKIQ